MAMWACENLADGAEWRQRHHGIASQLVARTSTFDMEDGLNALLFSG